MTNLCMCGNIISIYHIYGGNIMINFLMISGVLLLIFCFPASIILTIIFAIKKKKKVIVSAICIPASLIISLVLICIGGYLYGQTDEYKEQLAQQESERLEKEEQERIDAVKKEDEEQEILESEQREKEEKENTTEEESSENYNEPEEQEHTEAQKEVGENIGTYLNEEKTVDEMTEEEYKEYCEQLWYDDIFFSEENLKGHHVRLEIYVEEWRYFEIYADQTTRDFIDNYNLQKDLFACGVSRGEPNSYAGGQINVYFSDDYGYKQSDYETGQELIIYGEIVDYSQNTWDGYNICGVMPRYIEEK